jgi:hypothetical protein
VLVAFACSSVRETKPLAYPGDGRATIDSIEMVAKKRGLQPVCKPEAYCKMQHGEKLWIHFKVSEDKVVLRIDVVDGKEMPEGEVRRLIDEATKLAESMWAEISTDALARERAAEAQAAAERAREEEAERQAQAAAAAAPSSTTGASPGSALDRIAQLRERIHGSPATTSPAGTGGQPAGPASPPPSASAQVSNSASCCVNGAFYDCPSAAAAERCGAAALGMMKCAMSGSMECADQCVKDNPPDTSGCQRAATRDGECTR